LSLVGWYSFLFSDELMQTISSCIVMADGDSFVFLLFVGWSLRFVMGYGVLMVKQCTVHVIVKLCIAFFSILITVPQIFKISEVSQYDLYVPRSETLYCISYVIRAISMKIM